MRERGQRTLRAVGASLTCERRLRRPALMSQHPLARATPLARASVPRQVPQPSNAENHNDSDDLSP